LTQSWQIFTPDNTDNGLLSNWVNWVAVDDKYVWFGMDNGLSRYTKLGKIYYQGTTSLTNLQQPVITNIGTINTIGRLYIESILKSQQGQVIAKDINSFYLRNSNIYMILEPNKKIYKPNEQIIINGKVYNQTEALVENIKVELKKAYPSQIDKPFESIFLNNIDLSPGEIYYFTATTTSDIPIYLKGIVNNQEIIEYINVTPAKLVIDVDTSQGALLANIGSNTLFVWLKNMGRCDLNISIKISGLGISRQYDNMLIPVGGNKFIETEFNFAKEDYVVIEISGDVEEKILRIIRSAQRPNLTLVLEKVYPEGYVNIPFKIRNQGSSDTEFQITFTLEVVNSQKSAVSKTMLNKTPNPKFPITQLPAWSKEMPKIVISEPEPVITNQGIEKQKIWGNQIKSMFPKSIPNPKSTIYNPQISFTPTTIKLTFYVPVWKEITGEIVYNLEENDYNLSYDYFAGTGCATFKVAKKDLARVQDLVYRVQNNNLLFDIEVENLGSNKFIGNVKLNLDFYLQEKPIELDIAQKATITITFTPKQVSSGIYPATVTICHNGEIISQKTKTVELKPEFIIEEVSGVQYGTKTFNFNPIDPATITVRIKNIAPVISTSTVKLIFLDIKDEKGIKLSPFEIGTINFNVMLPQDLEAKDYEAEIKVNWAGEKVEKRINFYINSINLNVTALWDKICYKQGNTATLTLNITNNSHLSLGTLNLYANVKFNSYDNIEEFQLIPQATITIKFKIPVEFKDNRIFYGIYTKDTGRGIYLNSIYIYEQGTITLIPDKQIYHQGEVATFTIFSTESGTLTLIAPGFNTNLFVDNSTNTVIFKLPDILLTGTYYIYYELNGLKGNVPIDVIGYRVSEIKANLDKRYYSLGDIIRLNLEIETSHKFFGMLKVSVYSQNKNSFTQIYVATGTFTNGINNLLIPATLTTTTFGPHSLMYELYLGTSTLELLSGRRDFDVYNIFRDKESVIEIKDLKIELAPYTLDSMGYLIVKEINDYPISPIGMKWIRAFEFNLTPNYSLNKLIKATFIYSPDEDIIEDSVKAYYITGGSWEEVKEQQLDIVNKRLTFYLPHLSSVGIGAMVSKPLSKVIVYPNPAREQVTFGHLPPSIKVRIFNVVGEEVYEYEGPTNNGKWIWQLQNISGEKVVSGIYIYVISAGGDKKVGKIGVVK